MKVTKEIAVQMLDQVIERRSGVIEISPMIEREVRVMFRECERDPSLTENQRTAAFTTQIVVNLNFPGWSWFVAAWDHAVEI